MKRFLFLLVSFLLIIIHSSCDVDAALLRGEYVEYNFPPGDSTEKYFVDADKIHIIKLNSKADILNNVSAANISALYVGDINSISTDTVFLYLPGNSSSLNGYWWPIRQMANIGGHHRYGLLAIDYRGFGQSEGVSTSTASMRQDLHAALDFLLENGLDKDRLVLYGLSLGSLPACQEAGDQMGPIEIEKIIIESPQSTADVFFQDAVGLSVPSSLVTDYNFNLVKQISKFEGSLQWMHGANDTIAPFDNAKAIYEGHNGDYKESHILPLGGHDFRYEFGFEKWGEVILDFTSKQ
ncbi:MAG: Uncharacterised protein [Owenweeksia sp. TMED14]|nr:MAG: Uncharacterised protein [Owenweeksia sp. TMED14]